MLIEGTAITQLLTFAGALLAIVTVNMVVVNHALIKLTLIERLVMVFGIIGMFQQAWPIVLAGTLAIVAVLGLQIARTRSAPSTI